MAVVEVKRAVPIVAPLVPAELEAAVAALFEPAKTVTVEPVAVAAGNSGKPLTRPEREYMLLVVLLVVIGAVVGILLDDGKRMYSPPDGVSIFALFYIGAQAIERLLEPLASFYGTTAATGEQDSGKPGGLSGRLTKSQAVKARDRALAKPDAAEAAKEAAWWQEVVEQIRRNTATLWAVASMIGMILAGWLGLLLLHAVNAPNAPRWLDIIITGIVIGAGTKPLHDLVENIQKSKEKKENPTGVSGQSAS
jgi:hypothetical protein